MGPPQKEAQANVARGECALNPEKRIKVDGPSAFVPSSSLFSGQ
jgi:hypothetical protein